MADIQGVVQHVGFKALANKLLEEVILKNRTVLPLVTIADLCLVIKPQSGLQAYDE